MTARPVVAAVDGSEESLRAAEWAALEARRRKAPLRIVSVVAVAPGATSWSPPPQAVASALRRASAHALGEAVARAGAIAPDLTVCADLLHGPSALAVADSGAGALMLVVGARGRGAFGAAFLGSVSRYTAMHAPCPVVVVQEETDAVHREIVVGVRDPDKATAALAFAFQEAALRGANLAVVHAWYWFPPALESQPDPMDVPRTLDEAERVSAAASSSLATALHGWRERYPRVTVRPDVVHSHPARVLASYSARADLVVIGRHDGSAGRPAVGAVQHAVLNHARGPVAIVPSPSDGLSAQAADIAGSWDR